MRRNPREQGSVMLLVVTLLAALFAGGAVALFLQVRDTRATAMVKVTRSSLFCAEAGLVVARPIIAANYAQWDSILDGNVATNPAWYPIAGDLDGDTVADYIVTVRDNDDEPNLLATYPGAADGNNTAKDNDLRVFVTSTCIKYPNAPREVMELIRYAGGGHVYRNQSGQGSGNTGNAN